MALLEPDVPEIRKKRTIWLLAGGAASLLIPLAGAIYLHISQNSGAPGPSGRSDLFEHREGSDQKLTPTQTVVPPSAMVTPARTAGVSGAAETTAGSSLDFIRGGDELKSRINGVKSAPAGAPAAATAPAAAAAATPAAAVAASTQTAKAVKHGKKAFTMPKLQPTRGFTNFSNGAKSAPGGGQSNQDMLKNLPPGAANDPQVQAYLKAHQGQ
jgi:hypothetical protein